MSSMIEKTVALLRDAHTDLRKVEVKAAAKGLPQSIKETLSSFSNGSGGLIILGLDENTGFSCVENFDARLIHDSLASACADTMSPPVRAQIDTVRFEDNVVVVAEIPELNPSQKPCYVKAKGEYAGSFIRTGDGNRHLTEYEILALRSNRGQPRDDIIAVTQATIDDLDDSAITQLLDRVRLNEPRAFRSLSRMSALQRLGVLVKDESAQLVS